MSTQCWKGSSDEKLIAGVAFGGAGCGVENGVNVEGPGCRNLFKQFTLQIAQDAASYRSVESTCWVSVSATHRRLPGRDANSCRPFEFGSKQAPNGPVRGFEPIYAHRIAAR